MTILFYDKVHLVGNLEVRMINGHERFKDSMLLECQNCQYYDFGTLSLFITGAADDVNFNE